MQEATISTVHKIFLHQLLLCAAATLKRNESQGGWGIIEAGEEEEEGESREVELKEKKQAKKRQTEVVKIQLDKVECDIRSS